MSNEHFLTTKKERNVYGLWFVGQNIIYMVILSYLSIFLTDEVGIATGAVATLLLVARIWDAINDPILGAIVDRVQPKKGKFKPWINAVSIIMPILTIAVFWNFNGSDGFNLTYAYISYIAWGMVYTVSDVPIFALATTMTDHQDERVKIISIGRLAAGLASLVIGLAAPQLIANMGYSTSIIIFMVIAFLVMLPFRFIVMERVKYKREETVTFKTFINAIIKNKNLLYFSLAYLLIGSSLTLTTIAPYFATWNLGDLATSTYISATMVVPVIALPLLFPWLIKKFGKINIFFWGLIFSSVVGIIQYFVGYENLVLFYGLTFIRGLGMFAPMLMNGMFVADCVEYGAYTTGKRNEGITFSIQTFVTKLGGALSSAISLWIIGAYGYQSGEGIVSQTASALQGIWVAYALVPVIGMLAAAILLKLTYKLKESDVIQMIQEMKEKHQVLEEVEA